MDDNKKIKLTLNINSFVTDVFYFQKNTDEIFIPLLKSLGRLQEEKNRRILVFLAAPPGAGKTALSLFLEYLSGSGDFTKIQSLSLDGFHHKSDYLKSNFIKIDGNDVLMADVKGRAETFDLKKLAGSLNHLHDDGFMWPVYDRILHDVAENKIRLTEKIVLFEGNWILLDEPGWRDLIKFCDFSIFIYADENFLENRLIDRKIRGGLSPEAARDFYLRSDLHNVRRVLRNLRKKVDLELELLTGGVYFIREPINGLLT